MCLRVWDLGFGFGIRGSASRVEASYPGIQVCTYIEIFTYVCIYVWRLER